MHHGEYEWNHDFPRIAREAGFKFCEFQNENIDWKFIGEFFFEGRKNKTSSRLEAF